MNNIKVKKYYRIKFILQSPLCVGSGTSDETDSDIVVDSKGNPYIPGSSMAGVYRNVLDKSDADLCFGKLLYGTNEINESSIITYDAIVSESIDNKNMYIGKRDMVSLDEYKVAISGKKFDFQILEPNIEMVTFIEVNSDEEEIYIEAIDKILSIWKISGLSFGSKTSRGYGLTKAIDICEAKFNLTDNDERARWIQFDIYNEEDAYWEEYKSSYTISEGKYTEIQLSLRLLGGLSIREYSTKVEEADYEQMKLHNNDFNVAVIPGTTWAGAFRNQIKVLGMNKEDLDNVFGKVKTKTSNKKSEGHKSRITFSESYIENGTDIVYSRNAIDRFSGGTVNGALYTESTRYYGDTKLTIRIQKDFVKMTGPYLAAAIMDLNSGYMAIGGLTAIGRGLFEVIGCNVNGNDIKVEYERIKEVLV